MSVVTPLLREVARPRRLPAALPAVTAPRRDLRRRLGVEPAARVYVLYFLLPFWMGVSLLDWIHHRRSRIEETAGTRESLLHMLMIAESGLPLMLAFFLEINTPVLALMGLNFLAHEATGLYDLWYAEQRREVTVTEDIVHSYMEAIPFTCLSLMLCLHWDQLRASDGGLPRFRLRPKLRPISMRYFAVNMLGFLTTVIGPYVEELLRCRRAERARAAGRSERP